MKRIINFKIYFIAVLFILLSNLIFAQDDLMNMLNDPSKKEVQTVSSTFKANRMINFQTVEGPGKRTLMYWIQHRFGDLNSGFYNWYGLDGHASIKMGLEYSYDGKLSLGVNRSNTDKLFDLYAKYRLTRQTINSNAMPVSIALFTSMNINSNVSSAEQFLHDYHRLSFVHQIMIARKFNDAISLQLSPIFVHYNYVNKATDHNDMFALAGLARFKVTRSTAIIAEYGAMVSPFKSKDDIKSYYNGLGLGFEIETGGHVFQVVFTNSVGITEAQVIQNKDNFVNGNPYKGYIKLGFNICRAFAL